MTITQALQRACQTLANESARLDAEYLLGAVLAQSRTYLRTWPERSLNTEQQNQFEHWLARRAKGEPVAHILGQWSFWTLDLEVAPCTLIPRPDTECLVEQALARFGTQGPGRVLDLGTGTGAIAVALASEWPDAQVVATDKHPEVVALAERNRARLGLANVQVLQSDWWQSVTGQFDLVVSNPPYIDATDAHLQQGDLRFEPHSALVADAEGLADIQHIISAAPDYLHSHGWLLLEHGWQQASAVSELLCARGFAQVESHADYGGHLRLTGGCWHGAGCWSGGGD